MALRAYSCKENLECRIQLACLRGYLCTGHTTRKYDICKQEVDSKLLLKSLLQELNRRGAVRALPALAYPVPEAHPP